MNIPRRHSGFTLIELLVALTILALISVAGYRGLNSVLQARERVAAETRKWQHLAFFFARLDQDIIQASHRTIRDQSNLVQAEWVGHPKPIDENDAELSFTRAGLPDQNGNAQEPQRISYRMEKNNIVMLRWPVLDRAPSTQPVRYILLEGVKEFSLRYLDDKKIWQGTWPPSAQTTLPPRAVEVTLSMEDGAKLVRLFTLP